jgi:hypothetical protein
MFTLPFPGRTLAGMEAKALQHTGEVVSSRRAEVPWKSWVYQVAAFPHGRSGVSLVLQSPFRQRSFNVAAGRDRNCDVASVPIASFSPGYVHLRTDRHDVTSLLKIRQGGGCIVLASVSRYSQDVFTRAVSRWSRISLAEVMPRFKHLEKMSSRDDVSFGALYRSSFQSPSGARI